ncbi:putative membrane protein [Labilithrix luteola]|uniref:Putative membrane protein n=1 Tax=Labilithrix luteola TaxID=1391654 RepID=A0A0K1QB19_9BACT|nr:DUF308 domain-containing protein [Labilithrix luteola]AKV02610.1 putative membrane protein [Labilithrix luteola]
MSILDDDQRASWSLLLRGVAGLLFGFLALAWLGAPAAPRALLFGGYALVDGLATASFAMDVRRHDCGSTFYFIRAAVGVVAGLSMLFFPDALLGTFRILVGVWAVSVGAAEVVLAARLRHEGPRATLSVAAGMFALLGGVGLLVVPSLSAYSVGGTFAYLALLSGAASTSVATRWQEHVAHA